MRNRLAIRYAVEGDLRFISHHDTLRLFERALQRAGLPVRYSEGFNPRPRIAIALPRPVGVASQDELLVVEMTEKPPEDALSSLSTQMPPGLTLISAEQLPDGQRRSPTAARYELRLETAMQASVAERAAAFLASEHVVVERAKSDRHPQKSVDLRAYIETVEVSDDRLSWRQSISQSGTARIGEILEAMGLPSGDYIHRVRREEVCYQG